MKRCFSAIAAACALSLLCLSAGAIAPGPERVSLEQAENQAADQTDIAAPDTAAAGNQAEDKTTGSVVAVVIAVLVVITAIALIIIFVPKGKRAG